ncbi:hypothetical protein BDR07DRAFT_711741 [Suillus spraguei]|nr:hypothetical protein BDR07DRAFT_711741 [Suillus spraguei]
MKHSSACVFTSSKDLLIAVTGKVPNRYFICHKMGQQISSDDSARTRILSEDTPSQRSGSVLESMLDSVNASEPASSASSQSHISSQTVCKQSPPRKFREVINEVTAPLTLSLVLENKGNVARDHLASERTYLAYVRTSLACASAGVGELTALVQLFTLSNSTNAHIHDQGGIDPQRFSRPLGATMVLLGLFILAYGLVRYFMTQAALVRVSSRRHAILLLSWHLPLEPSLSSFLGC